MSSARNREVWTAFFTSYRNLPELWDITDEGYRNKVKRLAAMKRLLKVYHEIEPDATLRDLKSKINNVRTSYRRELKRVHTSRMISASEENIYTPQLWYFDLLHFLERNDSDPLFTSTSQAAYEDSTDSVSEVAPPKLFKKSISVSPPNRSITPARTPKPIIDSEGYDVSKIQSKSSLVNRTNEMVSKTDDLLRNISKSLETNEDDSIVFAKSWACSYRKLSETQKLYAKKAIEDILILGQLDQLSFDTVNTKCIINNI